MDFMKFIGRPALDDDGGAGFRADGWPLTVYLRSGAAIDRDNAWGVKVGHVYTDDEERELRHAQDLRKSLRRRKPPLAP